MQDLRIALCQTHLAWHDWPANKRHLTSVLATIDPGADLVLLPETFSSGFTMEPEKVSTTMDGDVVAWMLSQARDLDAVVMGSAVIREEDRFYNRLIAAFPDSSTSFYDKRHLFSYAGESDHYTRGNHRLVVDINGWRVCPMICYDLRFPVWSRQKDDYDLLLYVANWPEARITAWKALLKARAIENQAYVAGVSRIGSDDNDITYTGQSQVIDFAGETVYHAGNRDEVGVVQLSFSALEEFRRRYNFLADKDAFLLK